MNVSNHHKRNIDQPKKEISKLIEKLASKDDIIWPIDKWSAMKFKDGLKLGSKGGHGIIRYTIVDYNSENGIEFQFTSPKGFHGFHKFRISAIDSNKTEVRHTINMKTHGIATIQWLVFIRWLHDALIEDALDNIENYFSDEKKVSKWSAWVKLWRWIFITINKTRVKATTLQNG